MTQKILQAQNLDFNRKSIESKKCDILSFPAKGIGKDRPKQLDSGIDQIVAKIAAKNGVSIALDIHALQQLSKEEKAIALARFKQNIKLCRKAGTKIKILGTEQKKEASALLQSLGASSQQAKEAIE
ncbi:MAG: RNase P subunit p30 family protein [archaeon]